MCSGEISIGSGEICPLHSSIGSSPWPSWFGRHPNPALGHFRALLFSYSLFLASQPPLYTAALGATHKSSIGPAAGHSGGCPSLAPAQFVMRACSDFWPLLGSTSSVETQARDCSSDLPDPCSTSPLLLEYFGDKWRGDNIFPAKLSGCYANLVACGLCHPLPCSMRQLRGRWSTPRNSLSAPRPLHDLYNAINGPSCDPHCHKLSNDVWLPLLHVLLIKLSKQILSQLQWKNLHHLHIMQSSSHCLTD